MGKSLRFTPGLTISWEKENSLAIFGHETEVEGVVGSALPKNISKNIEIPLKKFFITENHWKKIFSVQAQRPEHKINLNTI